MLWKSSIHSGYLKMLDFNENLFFLKYKKTKRKYFFRFYSTSYPSGNQVDGSPLVAIPNRGELA